MSGEEAVNAQEQLKETTPSAEHEEKAAEKVAEEPVEEDDDDDDDDEDKWVPYSKRPEWADLKPIPQDDGPHGGICAIAYTPQFRETMDYFRAIIKAEEKSPRALELTGQVIRANAANYTAWFYRRQVLLALDSDIKEELGWTERIAKENPKNYQIWYHRRELIERSRDPSLELDFTLEMLIQDTKNYHAWAHRQWVLQEFGLWADEMKVIHQMLLTDNRNNSAWNQRYFVLVHTADLSSLALKKTEIEYAQSQIKRAPNNPSPWNYLRGMCKGVKYEELPYVKQFCLDLQGSFPTCAHVVSLLVDIYEQENTPSSLAAAVEGCEKLATKLTTIHSKYWYYRKDLALQKAALLSAQ